MSIIKNNILKQFQNLSEENYRIFSQKIVPNSHIIGVRTPLVRKIAKEALQAYTKEEIIEFINTKSFYLEEFLIKAIFINLIKTDELNRINLSRSFVKQIPNWAVCDMFCEKKKREFKSWCGLAEEFKYSQNEFELRFYYVFMLKNCVDEDNLNIFLDRVSCENSNKYYIQMAAAWAICEYFIKFPDEIFEFLRTYENQSIKKMAIRKVFDSFRISDKYKDKIRRNIN